jgi:hypothetical protein
VDRRKRPGSTAAHRGGESVKTQMHREGEVK